MSAAYPPSSSVRPPSPYPSWAGLAAGVATFVAPFVSLIVGGAMLASETDEARRKWLRTWLIASGCWMLLWLVVVVGIGLSAGGAASSSCRGGIQRMGMDPPSYQSSDGKHWTATYPCWKGGSTTVPVPANQVPGGGR